VILTDLLVAASEAPSAQKKLFSTLHQGLRSIALNNALIRTETTSTKAKELLRLEILTLSLCGIGVVLLRPQSIATSQVNL
jgi:hypothetical protein